MKEIFFSFPSSFHSAFSARHAEMNSNSSENGKLVINTEKAEWGGERSEGKGSKSGPVSGAGVWVIEP